MIKFEFNQEVRERFIVAKFEALEATTLISFDQQGQPTLHVEDQTDLVVGLVNKIEFITDKNPVVTSNVAFENFTVALPLWKLQKAFQLGVIYDILKVRWEVRDVNGKAEFFTMSVKELREWESMFSKCSRFNKEPAADKYRVSPAVFRERYEVRGGKWQKRTYDVVGVAAAIGISTLIGMWLPTSIAGIFAGITLFYAFTEQRKLDKNK